MRKTMLDIKYSPSQEKKQPLPHTDKPDYVLFMCFMAILTLNPRQYKRIARLETLIAGKYPNRCLMYYC
jgi:hypothetical protein